MVNDMKQPLDLALELLREDRAYAAGCEHGNSLAGWSLTQPVGPCGARWAAEAVVCEALAQLEAEGEQ